MLDYVCIFTKGGTLLWALSFVGALKGDPVNALIRACLLEERAAQSHYEYIIPSGGAYTLKWTLNNVRGRQLLWELPLTLRMQGAGHPRRARTLPAAARLS